MEPRPKKILRIVSEVVFDDGPATNVKMNVFEKDEMFSIVAHPDRTQPSRVIGQARSFGGAVELMWRYVSAL
jgi:hypothetical protein